MGGSRVFGTGPAIVIPAFWVIGLHVPVPLNDAITIISYSVGLRVVHGIHDFITSANL